MYPLSDLCFGISAGSVGLARQLLCGACDEECLSGLTVSIKRLELLARALSLNARDGARE